MCNIESHQYSTLNIEYLSELQIDDEIIAYITTELQELDELEESQNINIVENTNITISNKNKYKPPGSLWPSQPNKFVPLTNKEKSKG